jgi:hypothetical protein
MSKNALSNCELHETRRSESRAICGGRKWICVQTSRIYSKISVTQFDVSDLQLMLRNTF